MPINNPTSSTAPVAVLTSGSFTGTLTTIPLTTNRTYGFPDTDGQVQLLRGDAPLCELFSHFLGDTGSWIFNVNGTSANGSYTNITDPTSAGIAQLTTGNTATGRAALSIIQVASGSILGAFRVGQGGRSIYAIRMRTPVPADGVDTFITKIGFLLKLDSSESVHGVFFRYNVSVSANWQIVCRTFNVETAVITSLPAAANTWDSYKIIVNNGGTAVDFFINNTNVGTITTNIPTANSVGAGAAIAKTLGTNGRTIEVDYQYVGVGL